MKIFIVFGIFLAMNAMADIEHKSGQENKPAAKELSLSRGCFREVDNLGCGHPSDDQGYFNACLAQKQADLSYSCRVFFEKLYGKTNP